MTLYCPECYKVEVKWVCCGGNDRYGHQCLSGLNHCYLQCPKCNKTYRLCGIYNTYSDYLVKEKEENINLNQKIKELEKEISELKDEKKTKENEFNSVKNNLEEKVKELEKNVKNESVIKKYDIEMKNNELKNLKVQFEKDLRIKELEYQIQINNIKIEYENKSKVNQKNLEKELDDLKSQIQTLKTNNNLLKESKNVKEYIDKEIELRCYSNEDNKFYYSKKVHLSENFSYFIKDIMENHSFNANDYIFKYDGKEIDKTKSLIENGIKDNIIIIIEKKREIKEN